MQITKTPKTVKQKPRVCAYARVSTDKLDQANSLAAQTDYWNRRFTQDPDVKYIGLFTDDGISGKHMKNRKGLNDMLAIARNGEIDAIYVKSISRFARNYTEITAVIRELRDMGVPIIFEKEGIDTLDPKCNLILSVMSSMAEEELNSMSKNARWATRKRFAEGSIELAKIYGYDYSKGKLTINPTEAEVVRLIFKLFLDGNGTRKIGMILDEMGYKPYHGGRWSANSIRGMLHNEKYIGDSLLQKSIYELKARRTNHGEVEQYYVENSHEPIVSREDFALAQKILAEKRSKYCAGQNGKRLYPLSGKIICGDCGKTFKRKTCAKGTNYENIKWACLYKETKGKTACCSNDIKDEVITALLIEAYNESLGYKPYGDNDNGVERLKALLDTEKELRALRVKGYITDALYQEKSTAILEEIRALEESIKITNKKIDMSKYKESAVLNDEMADFLIRAVVKEWTVKFEFKNGCKITKTYTNGRAGNVNGKLCKHKTEN